MSTPAPAPEFADEIDVLRIQVAFLKLEQAKEAFHKAQEAASKAFQAVCEKHGLNQTIDQINLETREIIRCPKPPG